MCLELLLISPILIVIDIIAEFLLIFIFNSYLIKIYCIKVSNFTVMSIFAAHKYSRGAIKCILKYMNVLFAFKKYEWDKI